MKRKRAALFEMVCLSLFTSSMGFTSPSTATMPQHLAGTPITTGFSHGRRSTLSLNMATSTLPSGARLSAEEESELLRQTVEMRRINKLESDLASRSSNYEVPLLSVRAKAAGYGEELQSYENGKLDGQTARDLLVTRNMALVEYCVTQVIGKGDSKNRLNSLSREDLVQEGAIGLARAVDKWNPAIGGKFSTYAVYWIRAAVLRCIAERDDMLRVPVHMSDAVMKINKAAKRLGLDLDNNNQDLSPKWRQAATAKKLAEEAGLSETKFEEAMKVRSRRYSGGYVTFETWMQKGEDLQGDAPSARADATTSLSSVKTEELRTTLSKFLRPKEIEALSWRYGLLDDNSSGSNLETRKEKANRYLMEAEVALFESKPTESVPKKGRFGEAMTFNEVGNKMQVSAEYGRKLCHKALAKLQEAAEDGRLEPALLF